MKVFKGEASAYIMLLSGALILLLEFVVLILCDYIILVIPYIALYIGIILVFLYSLFLWGRGLKNLIVESEIKDENSYLNDTDNSGLHLKVLYEEYCDTYKTKKYSTWHDDVREKLSKKIEEENKKKTGDNSVAGFTLDMKNSLRTIKRRVAFTDELYKTVLLPAELGFIAIICTAGILSSPLVVLFAAVFTLFVCCLFTRMLMVNRRIDHFVDDFIEVIGVDLMEISNGTKTNAEENGIDKKENKIQKK